MPAGSYDVVNPLLEPKAKGVFRPQPGSPAIDSAGDDYPAVVFDLDGQPRTGLKDKGADEYSTDPDIAEFLTPGAILRLIHGGRP
jgi:poly(beta-D-mannuronate) lyase